MVATNPTFIQQTFYWDEKRNKAALMLASGASKVATAQECEIDRVTLYHWLEHPDFASEVDRLSLMVHISSRAERLRIAMRVAKARAGDDDSVPVTDKDLLDWLKFAQSETDGAKIDLSKLAELLSGEQGAQAQDAVGGGSSGHKQLLDDQSVIETTATTSDSPDGPSTSSSQSDELDFNPS